MSKQAQERMKGSRSLGRVARTSVMWAYLRTGAETLIAIPTAVILARLLSPADFGIAAAAVFFGQLASRLSSAGMGSALMRIKEMREEHVSTVFVANTVVSAIAALALVVAAPFIGAFYHTPAIGKILPVVALDFLLGALCMIQQALLSRELRYRELSTLGATETAVSSSMAVVFALFGFQYWSLVLGDVAGSFVKWIWGVRMAGWHLRFKFVPSAARELMSFALGSYAKRTLETLTLNVDNLVIGRTLGVTSLGFYDKAFSSVNRIYNKMTMVGPTVSFRIFAIIQDEPERFRRAYRKTIMTVTLLGYVIFATMGTMAPQFVVLLFGEKWRPSIVPLQLLSVAGSLKLLNSYAVVAATARGWIWAHVWRQIVQVLCIVAGVYIASRWGINGASAAVVVAMIVMFFLTQTMMHAATGLGWRDILEPQIPAVATSLLIGATLWGIDLLFARAGISNIPVEFVMQGAAAAICCLAVVWCSPFAELNEVIHEILSDISPKLAWMVPRRPRTEVAVATSASSAASAAIDTELAP